MTKTFQLLPLFVKVKHIELLLYTICSLILRLFYKEKECNCTKKLTEVIKRVTSLYHRLKK